jgi:hypothetical protein
MEENKDFPVLESLKVTAAVLVFHLTVALFPGKLPIPKGALWPKACC